MAYRELVIGDDVKIVKCQEWSGHFGKVLDIEGEFIKVQFSSWRNEPSLTHYFTEDKLLLSTGNPYRNETLMYDYTDPDYDEEDEQPSDSQIMQDLLQRVAKLEKEMLDMKQRQA